MAVSLKLYKYAGETLQVNKTLPTATSLSGDQVDNYNDLLNPSFIINVTGTTAAQYNYAYCSTYKRYYYIDRITWVGGTAYQIDCHVDVLKTYYSNITALSAMVKYSASGSPLEFDPRMNYRDQPLVASGVSTNSYPAFLKDYTGATNDYTSDPLIMLRYYDLPEKTGGGNNHDADTTTKTAFMTQATFNAFIDRYLTQNATAWGVSSGQEENARVDFGSRIIDVINVYYISVKRLIASGIPAHSDLVIRTPKYPSGLTVSLSGAGVGSIYVVEKLSDVSLLGYAVADALTIPSAVWWWLHTTYYTKLPYIQMLNCIPANMGIQTAESLYYAIGIDPYACEYVITPMTAADGSGTWYYKNMLHIPIKTYNAFPVDTAVDQTMTRNISLVLSQMQSTADVVGMDKSVAQWAQGALDAYGKSVSTAAAEAMHYQYTSPFNGASEWTPVDSKKLWQISVCKYPETDPAAFAALWGYPDNDVRVLSTLSGYAMIDDIKPTGFSTATKTEVDEIVSLLKSGVIF